MASSNSDDSTERTTSERRLSRSVGVGRFDLRAAALSALRVAAFWAAVVLPFVAAAVFLTGLESSADWWLFGTLVVTSVVSMYVGHSHDGG